MAKKGIVPKGSAVALAAGAMTDNAPVACQDCNKRKVRSALFLRGVAESMKGESTSCY